MHGKNDLEIAAFASDLGWMAVLGAGTKVRQLVFGYATREAAIEALDPKLRQGASERIWCPQLVERLCEYALGAGVDLSDVEIDVDHLTPFERRVVTRCRAIPYGQTQSYGQLARQCGSAGAARAVGNAMAHNRYPLIVPCHRVVHAGGGLGGFSAPAGTQMKRRLLAMECASGSAAWG